MISLCSAGACQSSEVSLSRGLRGAWCSRGRGHTQGRWRITARWPQEVARARVQRVQPSPRPGSPSSRDILNQAAWTWPEGGRCRGRLSHPPGPATPCVLGGNAQHGARPYLRPHLPPSACPTRRPWVGWVHEGPHSPAASTNPVYPPPCLSPRLRSVKIEQGKLNDQTNTLADLAKVSQAGLGRVAPQASRGWSGPSEGGWETFSKEQSPPPARGGTVRGTGRADGGLRPGLQGSTGSACQREARNPHL